MEKLIDLEKMIRIRRRLHQYPETAFDLPRTLALVRQELAGSAIPFQEDLGKSSLVALINADLADQGTIALRADLDALDINEQNPVDYRSKIQGRMHACGHDAHTAILLGTAAVLMQLRHQIPCRVMLIFQAAEEAGGAIHLVNDGITGMFDLIAGLHVTNEEQAGTIAINEGTAFAAAKTFALTITGRTGHAALPKEAVDAIEIAVAAYGRIKEAARRACPADQAHVLSVCTINGGQQTNLIADKCTLKGTIRTETDQTMQAICQQVEQAAQAVARAGGGEAVWSASSGCPALVNHATLVELMAESAQRSGARVVRREQASMLAEDFAILKGDKPCVYFLLGSGNQEKGITAPLHSSTFDVDEQALATGASALVQFVLDISARWSDQDLPGSLQD